MKTLVMLLLLAAIPASAQYGCKLCGNIPLSYYSGTIQIPPNSTVKDVGKICKKAGLKFVKDTILEDDYNIYDISQNPPKSIASLTFFEKRLSFISYATVFADSATAENYRKSTAHDLEKKTGCLSQSVTDTYKQQSYKIEGVYCKGKPEYQIIYNFYFSAYSGDIPNIAHRNKYGVRTVVSIWR